MATLTNNIFNNKTLPHYFTNQAEILGSKLNDNFRFLLNFTKIVANDPLLAQKIVDILDIGATWKSPVGNIAALLDIKVNYDGDVRLVKTGTETGLYKFDAVKNEWVALTSSAKWKNPVGTTDNLPSEIATPLNEVGDVRLVVSENKLYVWIIPAIPDSPYWKPVNGAYLSEPANSIIALKSIVSNLQDGELKFVRSTGEIWEWNTSDNNWKNITPKTQYNILENSSFFVNFNTSQESSSASDREMADKWDLIANGNSTAYIKDASVYKFGNSSLRVSPDVASGVIKIVQTLPLEIANNYINRQLSFNLWVKSSIATTVKTRIVSFDGSSTISEEKESTIGSYFSQTDIVSIQTASNYSIGGYIRVEIEISNTANYNLDGAILTIGESRVLQWTPNTTLDEILKFRQGKDNISDVVGLLSDLLTKKENSKLNYTNAINSIITFDVNVTNSSELDTALLDSNIKSIFIKNGTYSLLQDYDIAGKMIIGESREGVVLDFSLLDNGFTFGVDDLATGTVSISTGSNSLTPNIGSNGQYIFLGKGGYGKPYLITGGGSTISENYTGETLTSEPYKLTSMVDSIMLSNLTIVGKKSNYLIKGFGLKNSVFKDIILKSPGTVTNNFSGISIENSFGNTIKDIDISVTGNGVNLINVYEQIINNCSVSSMIDNSNPKAFYLENCNRVSLLNCSVSDSSQEQISSVVLINSSENIINNLNMKDCLGECVTIDSNSHDNLLDNSQISLNTGTSLYAIYIDGNNNKILNNNIKQQEVPVNNIAVIAVTGGEGNIIKSNIINVENSTINFDSSIIKISNPSTDSIVEGNKIKVASASVTNATLIHADRKNTLIHSNSLEIIGAGMTGIICGDESIISDNIIMATTLTQGTAISSHGKMNVISSNMVINIVDGIDLEGNENNTLTLNKFSPVLSTNIIDTSGNNHIFNDPEIDNARTLYKNKDWFARNSIRNYPIIDGATIPNELPQSCLYGLYLLGSDQNKRYYISRVQNIASDYIIEITDYIGAPGNIVAKFESTSKTSERETTIISSITNDLISGAIYIDWNKVATGNNVFTIDQTEISPDLCLPSIAKQWQESNAERKYPFIDAATYSGITDKLFTEMLLFNTSPGNRYHLSSIKRDVSGSLFEVFVKDFSGTVVARFIDSVEPTLATLLSPSPGQSVSGFAQINWSLLPDSPNPVTFSFPDTEILNKNYPAISIDVVEWYDENKSRKFPFTPNSVLTNGSVALADDHVYGCSIYGAGVFSETFFISKIRKGTGSPNYRIEVSGTASGLVLSWENASAPGEDFVLLTEEGGSGMEGFLKIDFSKFQTIVDDNYLVGQLDILPDCYGGAGLAGSLLDADTLDGYSSDEILKNTHTLVSASNLAVGWYTIATNTGDRAIGRFGLRDISSGRHATVVFYASHMFGTNGASTLTVLSNSKFGNAVLANIRIKGSETYDGAALQVYISNSSNALRAYLLGDDFQSSGWVLKSWIPDAIDPGDVDDYGDFTTDGQVNLSQSAYGGMNITGDLYAGGDLTQYKVWHQNDFSSADVANWNIAYGWGDLANTYLPLIGGTITGNLAVNEAMSVGKAIASNVKFDIGGFYDIANDVAYGILNRGAINGTVTNVWYNRTVVSLGAPAVITTLLGYGVNQIPYLGRVTNQYAFFVESNWIGASEINVGFNSNIPSGPGRWNFYAVGTADNYFKGDTGFGLSNPSEKLDVVGNIKLTGVVTASGGNSTNWNTAYDYSQVGHLPLSGGTITGNLTVNDLMSIGKVPSPYTKLDIGGTYDIVGNVTFGIFNRGSVDGTVTNVYYNKTVINLGASANIANLYGYYVNQGLYTGAVDNQYAFRVDSNFFGASGSNMGFVSLIPFGSGRWNFYAGGAANNYFKGDTGIGVEPLHKLHVEGQVKITRNVHIGTFSPVSYINLYVRKKLTGSASSVGIHSGGIIQSDVTLRATYFRTHAQTQFAFFNLTTLIHYDTFQETIDLYSNVYTQIGFRAHNTLIGASTSNIGFYGDIRAGSGRWNFYAGGTAGNYFKGNVLISVFGNLSFESSIRQMINLYGTSYGIGVQPSTLYLRSGFGFAWFKGGSHSSSQNAPGAGGTLLMDLSSSGNLNITGNITRSGMATIKNTMSGTYGSFEINGGSHGSYEGFSIRGKVVFMLSNTAPIYGIYDDENNDWLIRGDRGGKTSLYYAGASKISTTNYGVNITGTLVVNSIDSTSGTTGNVSHRGTVNITTSAGRDPLVMTYGEVNLSSGNQDKKLSISDTGRIRYFALVSDLRYKTKVVTLSTKIDVLKALKGMRGIYYKWDLTKSTRKIQLTDTRLLIGVGAQEIEKQIPELVNTSKETGLKSIEDIGMTGLFIEVQKKLLEKIEVLEKQVALLS